MADKLITPECRAAFCGLFRATAPKENPNGAKKFSIRAVFMPGADLSALKAAARLRGTTNALLAAFQAKRFSKADIMALVAGVSDAAIRTRYTDYEGSSQAVMAVDTLLNALVNNGSVSAGQAAAIRDDINRAYAAVKDPYTYQPLAFRASLAKASAAIGSLQ